MLRLEVPVVIGKCNELICLDEEIIVKVTNFGYPKEQLRRYLQKCELNNATTAYYLLEQRKLFENSQ
jgi:hypothetical protein